MGNFNKLDSIFNIVDDLCLENRFEEVDSILKNVDINNSSTSELLSYLTITKVYKKYLRYRDKFYSDIFKKFVKIDDFSSEKIFSLLEGLN